jgi:hypothetical protein
MSKLLSLSMLLLFACSIAIAQSPQQFAYQAVVRDNNNQLVSNRTIGMRVSILKDSTNGQSAYTETHTPKTNQQGIIQLNIGGGTVVSGSFASVPWSSGKLFVKTEMDLQGGTNYTISGTTQLLSVPYAMYSSNVPVSKSGDTVTIGTSKLIIPGSQLLPGTAPASLSNGLVAYYPFNGNANDESGNGNHGTVNGATLTSDRFGVSNKAYLFNGASKISIPHSNSLNVGNEMTIVIWYNRGTMGNTINYMLQKGTGGGCAVTGYNVSIDYNFGTISDGGKLLSFGNNGKCASIGDNKPISAGWHQLVFIYSPTTENRIYVDGTLISNPDHNPCQNCLVSNSQTPLVIGGFYSTPGGFNWNGQ